MSKVILEFDIPEQTAEANLAINGGKYFVALHDLDQKLRDIAKYENNPFGGGKATNEQIELAEKLREYLRENIVELWR